MVGTGANGAAFGADMARAGLDVTFIEQWPAHVEAMRANGIRVEMPDETQVTPVHAFHLCEVAELREPVRRRLHCRQGLRHALGLRTDQAAAATRRVWSSACRTA